MRLRYDPAHPDDDLVWHLMTLAALITAACARVQRQLRRTR